jgi:pyrroline-5-carboxylate reductase
VIAVKPHNVRAVALELASALRRQVVLTIAAGIRLSDLSRWLGGYRRLVRAMPNTPALIGAGIAGLFAMPGVDAEGRARAAAVLDAVGATLWCEREEDLDAVTAVSGSGPAYVFYFMEALDAAARELGFAPEEARRLALATFSGAARLAEQSDSEPALLRAQVTSKGGTTERAIAALEDARVKDAILAAVKAAAARAREMGEQYGGEE